SWPEYSRSPCVRSQRRAGGRARAGCGYSGRSIAAFPWRARPLRVKVPLRGRPWGAFRERRSSMKTLVLLRHGESAWNLENRFTGWTDVDLTPKGIEEATAAGRLLKEGGYAFDVAHTSVLRRAIRTLWITLDGLDLMWVPVS